jgi:hypothetical protein
MEVCDCCFKDEEIKRYIVSTSTEIGFCDCCSNESSLIEYSELDEFFSKFFSIFKYDETGGRPIVDLVQDDWNLFSSKAICIKIFSEFEIILALTLELGLIGSGVTVDSSLKVSYIDDIQESVDFWSILKEELKWKKRFLTNTDELEELSWDRSFQVYSLLDFGTLLYRSRINQDGQITPFECSEMGAPSLKFISAGRANPQGIPYLYLSRAKETTVYETRATYLDTISIGTFQIPDTTILKLVDFTSKESPFNYVDTIISFAIGRLLRDVVSQDLSKPMRRYDSELEYIPTQFICEYIRVITGADGIQFNSSLDQDGVNVVLFDPKVIDCISVELHQVEKVAIKSIAIV